MITLLAKEFRNQRAALVLGLLLLISPYMISLVYAASYDVASLPRFLLFVSTFSIILSQISILTIGATIIAVERQERTSEFMNTLPIGRGKIIASKFLFCLLFALSIWAVYFVVTRFLMTFTEPFSDEVAYWNRWVEWITLSGSVVVFGVAWLGSVFFHKPLFAACFSAGVTLLFTLGISRIQTVFEYDFKFKLWTYLIAFLVVGVSGFVAGSILYQRQIDP